MAHVLLIVALACALAVAAWFAVRCLLLKRSLRRADAELREIVERLEENRIVKLPSPDADLEALLGTVNASLAGIRRQAALYARREADLKAQVERISHDLRTPLTSIQGYLALVDESALDAEARASLATVRRKADALQRLIAQFYDLSRFEAEDFHLELGQVDVGRLVRESVAEQYRLLEERGLDVRVEVPRHAVKARANAEALERVFENLLHNVSKYARSSFEAVVEEENAEVAVVFANDVDDVGRLDAERLFEPHYAADASRSQESSGLGLTIARHLTERMGGTLEARAEERDGVAWLSFALRLPQVEPGILHPG
ncbi:sensor histidine kinase [Enteroscipio rubneri]|uniref:histidine kinase n=1 Tax=Enteroscipio rubneri TaxID=2070686 RepID=A0A2K2UAY9_9ACTN|nr:sensor histidine kinase [Enteroscipio rubneri]